MKKKHNRRGICPLTVHPGLSNTASLSQHHGRRHNPRKSSPRDAQNPTCRTNGRPNIPNCSSRSSSNPDRWWCSRKICVGRVFTDRGGGCRHCPRGHGAPRKRTDPRIVARVPNFRQGIALCIRSCWTRALCQSPPRERRHRVNAEQKVVAIDDGRNDLHQQ